MKGFLEFIREQGVVGLAVGFILGSAVSRVVAAIIADIVNPLIGLLLGSTRGLENAALLFFGAKISYGHFLSVLIDFTIISAVVYFIVKGFGLDRIDRKKMK